MDTNDKIVGTVLGLNEKEYRSLVKDGMSKNKAALIAAESALIFHADSEKHEIVDLTNFTTDEKREFVRQYFNNTEIENCSYFDGDPRLIDSQNRVENHLEYLPIEVREEITNRVKKEEKAKAKAEAKGTAAKVVAGGLAGAILVGLGAYGHSVLGKNKEDEIFEISGINILNNVNQSTTKNQMLSSLGASLLPSSITIYPKDFESKEQVVDYLDRYNKKMEKAGKDEQVISYTDVVGTLMSSVTDIINTISYVLIAFVAISLVVSSIMIGVITYISVLERKKEIGILRAIGASKRNVSQVFNAETFIIGLCAGLIGIGLTLLLLLPGNMIIHAVADNSNVNAVLPVIPALVLIALSVVLTLLGGLIPSKKASKSDPVTALRTE